MSVPDPVKVSALVTQPGDAGRAVELLEGLRLRPDYEEARVNLETARVPR